MRMHLTLPLHDALPISACLIGYGATAVYPYMAYQTLYDMMKKGEVAIARGERIELGRRYRKAVCKGLFKIISKMGISTIASRSEEQTSELQSREKLVCR